ncbi:MAG: hypothetical protein KKF50_05250 [Nanoarchaeota archaeon]|nr:hypothetical protein [Nanoarchaeota archaeon]
MSSEKISVIAMEPFINKFVFTIIKTIRKHNLDYEERNVINADLIPRVSGVVMHASMMGREIPVAREIEVQRIPKHQYRDMSALIAPIRNRHIRHHHMQIPAPIAPQPMIPSRSMAPSVPVGDAAPQKAFEINRPMDVPLAAEVTSIPGEVMLSQDYGKITPLLNDPSVSSIECQGHDKNIMVIRAGQRQITRIILSTDEIREILQKISDAIHIPLLEGVFRAAADNFSVNAVISEMIGSRFIIKKQTPYALLE